MKITTPLKIVTPPSSPATPLSIADAFKNIQFFTPFLLVFTVDDVCYISNKYQPPCNLAKHQYFYTRDFISLLHFENALHRMNLWMFFETSTFSLFLKVRFVNTSSKCWLLNKPANKIFLHRTPYTPLLFPKRNCALHGRCF